jgi:hypothetical protein
MELQGFDTTTTVKQAHLIGFWFFLFLMLKTDSNSIKLIQFEPVLSVIQVILTKKYYFSVQLIF